MKIIIPEGLRCYFNGSSELCGLPLGTMKTTVQYLCNEYPQLAAHLLEYPGSITWCVNGALAQEAALDVVLPSDAVLEMVLLPHGEYAAAGTAISSATSGAISAAAGQVIAQVVVAVAVSVAISALTSALFGSTDSAASSVANSAVYTFNGIQNTTASGTALQLVYGTHRVGGQVMNLFTEYDDSTATLSTYLYAQYGLSEGEVAEISDVRIDKNPLYYYTAVTAYTECTGKETQEAMSEFQASQSTQTVTKKARCVQNPPTVAQVLDTSLPIYGYVLDSTDDDDESSLVCRGMYVYAP